jgi:hypothetical protein
MDFHETCRLNNAAIEAGFKALLLAADAASRAALTDFADFVKGAGRVGINMRPMVLLDFLNHDRLLNIHEWASRISARSGKPAEDAIREKLGAFCERRMAFDNHFDGGIEFRYGALNAGGLGAFRYGEYCSIFRHGETLAHCRVGYLKGDSLTDYMTFGPAVDAMKLSSECATDSHKHFLATLKHSSEAATQSPDEWPEMLCGAREYIEAVLNGDLRPQYLETVRIAKLDFDLYWEYAYNEFREKLSELDRYRVDSFAAIDEALQTLGVTWETVERA